MPDTIEWKARKSVQQKELTRERETAAGSKPTSAAVKVVSTEEGKDIHLLEMGSEEATTEETEMVKKGTHDYTHHLK